MMSLHSKECSAILRPIIRPNLSEEIITRILELISSGEVQPGDKLPSERVLADLLNVGRSSVREAIKALTVMGILEVKAGGGTYVKSDGPSLVGNSIEWGVLLSKDSVRELIHVRYLVEPHLAWLAARERTDNDIAMLSDIVKCMGLSNDFEEFSEYDMEFHIALGNVSKNRILENVIDTIQVMLRAWIKKALRSNEDIPIKIQEHKSILDAIIAGDVQKAEDAMIYHLDRGNERFWKPQRERMDPDSIAPSFTGVKKRYELFRYAK